MVILLVTMGKALLPQLLTALVVDVGESCAALRQGVVLKDICHVMEQPRHCKEHLRRCRSALPSQKTLCVAVPLLRRLGQPLDTLLFVSVDHLPLEQQLPQQKDQKRDIITAEEARRLKDTVRDMLFDALNEADVSNEGFERSISSERLYPYCGVTRKAKPRGRPRKGGGDA